MITTYPKTNSKRPWKFQVFLKENIFQASIFRGKLAISFTEGNKTSLNSPTQIAIFGVGETLTKSPLHLQTV